MPLGMPNHGTRVIAPGEGKTVQVMGETITFKAVSEQTGGMYVLYEELTPPQAGPPLLMHHREEKTFYILEGEYEFQLADRFLRASAGALVVAARLIPHRFRNLGDGPARMLVIARPAGVERFLEELSRLPGTNPVPKDKLTAISQRYGIEYPSSPAGLR